MIGKLKETKMFRMREQIYGGLVRLIVDLFGRPAIAMVAWGAFIEMSGTLLPKFGYWEFFMLNLAAMILTSSQIGHWVIKKED